MFVLANFVYAIAVILNIVIVFAITILIIDSILSFILPYYHPFRRILDQMCDPMVRPLRRFIPPIGMFDFSPFVALLILIFLQAFVVNTLFDLSIVLKR
ncbi:YggT family protein [Mesoaciditoga lauensis]|uniref:YggT family protein n=1 Tax=Mesoaciditoga lauensis TaxID=1495039 RepID=UPI000567805B